MPGKHDRNIPKHDVGVPGSPSLDGRELRRLVRWQTLWFVGHSGFVISSGSLLDFLGRAIEDSR
jgi:hypothetical protein